MQSSIALSRQIQSMVKITTLTICQFKYNSDLSTFLGKPIDCRIAGNSTADTQSITSQDSVRGDIVLFRSADAPGCIAFALDCP